MSRRLEALQALGLVGWRAADYGRAMASDARRRRRAYERAATKERRRHTRGPQMRIDVKSQILDYQQKPALDGNDDVTLFTAIWLALNMPGEQAPAEEKLRRYRLTEAAAAAARTDDGLLELSLDDAAFILQKSGINNIPLLHGRLSDALEPPEETKTDVETRPEAVPDVEPPSVVEGNSDAEHAEQPA